MTRVLRGPSAHRVVSASTWSAEEEAAAIRARARRDATTRREEIEAAAQAARDQWTADLAAARRQAEERGFAEGRRRGQTQGLRDVLDAFGAPTADPHRSGSLVSVVVDAAAALLGEALEADPNRVASIVRRTMDRVRRAQNVRVEVHPEDVSSVAQVATTRGAIVSPNASLARGDCILRTNLGTVDGRLTTRLSILRDALEGGR